MDVVHAAQRVIWRTSERLQALAPDDIEERWICLSELLWWIVVLDEHFLDTDPDYRQRRDGDSEGRKLAGARWARNRVAHQRALVVDTELGAELEVMRFDVSALDTSTQITWARVDQLPPADHGRDSGRPVYERFFQSMPVAPILDALRAWLLVDAQRQS